jgi:Mrp family chromosome partitioning ATPase
VFLLSNNGSSPRAVVFCGIEGGSGTSWVCAKVARAVAAQGAKLVCAVDVNLHAPALHTYLRVANRSGLVDAVRRTGPIRTFLQPAAGGNLWVLPAGLDAGASLILTSERFRERVNELRAEFDCVIFDAPPITDSGEAALIGQLLDGVVVVVGANSTRRETARMAKESLEAAHVRILGTVLNKRTFPIPEALYRWL